jgi:hypothetical protein
VKEAYELDKHNGNTKWKEGMDEEIAALYEYNTVKDMGEGTFIQGYKIIVVHLVFAVKHVFDTRHAW